MTSRLSAWSGRRCASQESQSDAHHDRDVSDGVYTRTVIRLQRCETATLRFHRRDPSPCAEHVIFHGLDIDEVLPVNGEKVIRITPPQAGTFAFTCQMQMYRGELRVES
mgnify:CR=1 FL=1